MPFVLVIIGLLGGLQIYFFGVADRAQKSVAAQVLLSRSSKNVNQEIFLEQLLAVQVQELMRRESITAIDLEKGVSSIVNAKNPSNPEADQKSVIFKPSTAAANAAKQLTEFRKLFVGEHEYRVKAFSSSLPRDPTGYVDLAVCPVKQPGMEEVDTRLPKRVRVRLSVKAGFLNAITGNKLYNVLLPGEVYGNVAEFGQRDWSNQWMGSRIYGNWLSAKEVNQPVITESGWPYGQDDGTELEGYPSAVWEDKNTGPQSEFRTMPMSEMMTDKFFKPQAFDAGTINLTRWVPWPTFRWWGFALEGTASHYDGPEIPWNPNTRSRSLPKFNPEMARLLARGTLVTEKVGAIKWIPYGKTWTEGPETINELGPNKDTGLTVIDGNMVIDGRDQPFRICGRVFVTGDIVVMGKYRSKNDKDEPCPSALIAGRNIYIADNLVASDRADIFDRTNLANVERLAQITNPTVEREIAEEIWSKDQLLLLATNNLIMGNPFPFEGKYVDVAGKTFIDPSIGNESSIISDAQNIAKYWEELYVHRATGVMSQAHRIGTKICFTLPWENVEVACRQKDGSDNFVSNERFVQIEVPTREWLMTVEDKYEAYRIWMNYLIPEAYWKLFLPLNVIDRKTGETKPWITETQFAAVTFNAADYAKYVQPDACGRRNVLLNTRIPYRNPATLKSMSDFSRGFVSEMNSDQMLSDIDKATGFLTAFGDNKAVYDELRIIDDPNSATLDPGTIATADKPTVREMIKRSLDLCIQRAKAPFVNEASAKPGDPKGPIPHNPLPTYNDISTLTNNITAADINPADAVCYGGDATGIVYDAGANNFFTRSSYKGWGDYTEPALFGTAGDERLKSQGLRFSPLTPPHSGTHPEAYLHFRCNIGVYVAGETSSCTGGNPGEFAVSTDLDAWEGPASIPGVETVTQCDLLPDVTTWPSMERTCIRQLIRVPYRSAASGCSPVPNKFMYFLNNAPAGMPREKYNFEGADLHIGFSSDDGGQPWIYVDSRFLEGKVNAGGLDREAFLKNRVKEVDGYLFSNQFIAHVAETVHDRTVQINGGISGRDFFGQLVSKIGPYRPNYDADPTKAFRTYYGGKHETGIVVAWDPRYRYGEDIMQSDIGMSELTENSADVIAMCGAEKE